MKLEPIASEHSELFLAFVADLREHDRVTFDRWFDRAWTRNAFGDFARECERLRLDWRPKAKQISSTTYLASDEAGVVGVGLLRFPLTREIEETGGNLVFIVTPRRRRQGLGPVLLNRLLFEGARAGLARALVTCDRDHVAARRSIEYNRGVSSGGDETREKFWIPLR